MVATSYRLYFSKEVPSNYQNCISLSFAQNLLLLASNIFLCNMVTDFGLRYWVLAIKHIVLTLLECVWDHIYLHTNYFILGTKQSNFRIDLNWKFILNKLIWGLKLVICVYELLKDRSTFYKVCHKTIFRCPFGHLNQFCLL